jgi:hypothetical protein
MRECVLYGHRGNEVVRVINGEVFSKDGNQKVGTFRDGAVYDLDGSFIRRLARPGPVTAAVAPDMASSALLAAD